LFNEAAVAGSGKGSVATRFDAVLTALGVALAAAG